MKTNRHVRLIILIFISSENVPFQVQLRAYCDKQRKQ